MSEKEKNQTPEEEVLKEEPAAEEPVAEETPAEEAASGENPPAEEPVKEYQVKYEQEHDARLRLAVEYENYRRRTALEKAASYTNGRSDAVAKLLPVYDNLERALNQPTEDAAYRKGVELTLNELVKIFASLDVEIFGQVGDAFDPNLHNAVMHIESEELGENVLSQVFQKGFKIGEKVVRFAMVQVAN